MRPPRYWHRQWVDLPALHGDSAAWRIPHWGWSSDSQEAAIELAHTRTKRSVISWSLMRSETTDSTGDDGWYHGMDYLVMPPREEILHEVLAQDGSATYWVSRNRYGAEVLNSRNLAIIDVDQPESFDTLEQELLDQARIAMEHLLISGCEGLQQYGFRIYRTFAGWRLMVTSQEFDGVTEEAVALMSRFPTDDLYRKLCVRHQFYRARLSPKPWRIGCERFGASYPYDTNDLARINSWLKNYYHAGGGFRTAALMYDEGRTASQLQPIITLHDAACGVDLDLPLA